MVFEVVDFFDNYIRSIVGDEFFGIGVLVVCGMGNVIEFYFGIRFR